MRHSGVSAKVGLLVIIATIVFFIAVLWFAVESFLYIRHVKRMKRIWELLEKLDLKPKE